jgi:hypothetical protein
MLKYADFTLLSISDLSSVIAADVRLIPFSLYRYGELVVLFVRTTQYSKPNLHINQNDPLPFSESRSRTKTLLKIVMKIQKIFL